MSGRGGRVDNRITKAAAFKLRCESASIPEAMRTSKFTLAESSNPAKQMAVLRAYEKLIGGIAVTPGDGGGVAASPGEEPKQQSAATRGERG